MRFMDGTTTGARFCLPTHPPAPGMIIRRRAMIIHRRAMIIHRREMIIRRREMIIRRRGDERSGRGR